MKFNITYLGVLAILHIQNVFCKSNTPRGKMVFKTNKLISDVFDVLSEHFNEIIRYEKIAVSALHENEKIEHGLEFHIKEEKKIYDYKIAKIRASTEIDTEDCFIDDNNARFFKRFNYNNTVWQWKTEFWRECSKKIETYHINVDKMKKEVEQAVDDVYKCDDDKECFGEVWEQLEDVITQANDGLGELRRDKITLQVFHEALVENWLERMQTYINSNYHDDDSIYSKFIKCVRNETETRTSNPSQTLHHVEL